MAQHFSSPGAESETPRALHSYLTSPSLTLRCTIQEGVHDAYDRCIISGVRGPHTTHFGRPVWANFFESMVERSGPLQTPIVCMAFIEVVGGVWVKSQRTNTRVLQSAARIRNRSLLLWPPLVDGGSQQGTKVNWLRFKEGGGGGGASGSVALMAKELLHPNVLQVSADVTLAGARTHRSRFTFHSESF